MRANHQLSCSTAEDLLQALAPWHSHWGGDYRPYEWFMLALIIVLCMLRPACLLFKLNERRLAEVGMGWEDASPRRSSARISTTARSTWATSNRG